MSRLLIVFNLSLVFFVFANEDCEFSKLSKEIFVQCYQKASLSDKDCNQLVEDFPEKSEFNKNENFSMYWKLGLKGICEFGCFTAKEGLTGVYSKSINSMDDTIKRNCKND